MDFDNEDYLTLEDLGDFTLDELGNFTLDELSMPVEEFIKTLRNKHKYIPTDTYKRLEKLCQDVSSKANTPITMPKNNVENILGVLVVIMDILVNIPEIYETYAPIVQELFTTIFHIGK